MFNGSVEEEPERDQPEKYEKNNEIIVSWRPRGRGQGKALFEGGKVFSMLNACKVMTKNMSIRFEDMQIICDPSEESSGGVMGTEA